MAIGPCGRYAPPMANPIESVVDTYVRAWSEPDPAAREAMIESCFAADGRIVTGNGVIQGRAALAAIMTRVFEDPHIASIRLTSAIDARKTTFRVHSALVQQDGTELPFFDAGEVDASGRIVTLLTFDGPLVHSDG